MDGEEKEEFAFFFSSFKRLGMDEEEKEEFVFFFSSFEAAFIAAGTEVEMAVAGDI